jgi:hypothetical protein
LPLTIFPEPDNLVWCFQSFGHDMPNPQITLGLVVTGLTKISTNRLEHWIDLISVLYLE